MSALHRLKVYFGMVPAEDFDDFDPDYRLGYDPTCDPSYDAAVHSAVESEYAAERPGARWSHRADLGGYHDGIAAAGPHAAPRVHATRPPSWAPESRVTESWATGCRAAESMAAGASVRGSLAIDTVPPVRQPAVSQPIAPPSVASAPRRDPIGDDEVHPLARIVTLHPHNYNEARPIGERYREGNPVIMNLTEMEDRDAKRLVDFAAGLAFALRGSIDKVTNKVFLLSPPNVDVSAEDRRRIAEGRFFN
ncbi:MAG TPA: cell division protein SepF [Pseudonocardiaceae bacterium]|nr:cell division protein SepF [Pseudonocardiaceae bacterium]